MSRPRDNAVNPFLYKVLAEAGYETAPGKVNIKAAANDFNIQYTGLNRSAAIGDSHRQLSFHLNAAASFGIPFDLWVKGLLGQLDESEEAELDRVFRKQAMVRNSSQAS